MREYDDLDLDTVMRAMRNELWLTEAKPSNDPVDDAFSKAEDALSLAYATHYVKAYGGEAARSIYETVCTSSPNEAEQCVHGLTEEWLLGRSLALAARSHVLADLDLVFDDFEERAITALEDGFETLLDVGELDDARLAGVDMERRPDGAHCVSPAFVARLAHDMDKFDCREIPEGKTATAMLSPADLAKIADEYNASLRDVEPDHDDESDIRGRISDALRSRDRSSAAPGRGVTIEFEEFGSMHHLELVRDAYQNGCLAVTAYDVEPDSRDFGEPYAGISTNLGAMFQDDETILVDSDMLDSRILATLEPLGHYTGEVATSGYNMYKALRLDEGVLSRMRDAREFSSWVESQGRGEGEIPGLSLSTEACARNAGAREDRTVCESVERSDR